MDPFTIAYIGGLGLQALGSVQQGQQSKEIANYNASLLEQNAFEVWLQARENERRQRIIGHKTLGEMRTGYGASGVAMEGTVLDVLAESARTAELDALTIRHQGELQANALRNQARLERVKGEQAEKAGQMGALSGLLGGIAGGKALGFFGGGGAGKALSGGAGTGGIIGGGNGPGNFMSPGFF